TLACRRMLSPSESEPDLKAVTSGVPRPSRLHRGIVPARRSLRTHRLLGAPRPGAPCPGAWGGPPPPFVRPPFWGPPRRFALPRRCALLWAWRESASCDAAAVPSPSRAWCAARDRVGFGLRPVACSGFFPGGGGSFTPA